MKNFILLLAAFVSFVQLRASDTPIACNLGALTPAERTEHASLTRKVFAAVVSRKETARGYSFELDRAGVSPSDVRRWAGLEARCCPFIEFAVDSRRSESRIVLRLSGSPKVKKFIAAELAEAGGFTARINSIETQVVGVAETMPEDRYTFAPTAGEFKGVRSFAGQIKHLAAANFQLGARILGEKPPMDEQNEQAPGSIATKSEIVNYAKRSFSYLKRAASTIDAAPSAKLDLLIDALAHSSNHYGQMVEYLRMSGFVPPAS